MLRRLPEDNAQSFRVTDSDVIRIKKQLAQMFQNIFVQQLTAKGEKYVTAVGKGVLILRPSILNLNIAAPQSDGLSTAPAWVTPRQIRARWPEFE